MFPNTLECFPKPNQILMFLNISKCSGTNLNVSEHSELFPNKYAMFRKFRTFWNEHKSKIFLGNFLVTNFFKPIWKCFQNFVIVKCLTFEKTNAWCFCDAMVWSRLNILECLGTFQKVLNISWEHFGFYYSEQYELFSNKFGVSKTFL